MGLGKTIEVISLILGNQLQNSTLALPQNVSPNEQHDPFGFLKPNSNSKGKDLSHLGGSIPSKATLIVCPLSTISNWEEQILSHVSDNTLSVYVYHGSNRHSDATFLAKHVFSNL